METKMTQELTELVIAFEPSGDLRMAIESLNLQLKKKWDKKTPIILNPHSKENNSVAHMTITHLRMEQARVAEVALRVEEICNALSLKRLLIKMSDIEMRGQFVFWNPSEVALELDGNFNALTDGLLDGKPEVPRSEDKKGSPAIESLCSLRAANFEPQDWWPDHYRTNNEKYGHPGIRDWHFTVGYVSEGLTETKLEIPLQWKKSGRLQSIMIGRRGPRGTITEVLERIPLP